LRVGWRCWMLRSMSNCDTVKVLEDFRCFGLTDCSIMSMQRHPFS
jgi:hypothetical protein